MDLTQIILRGLIALALQEMLRKILVLPKPKLHLQIRDIFSKKK